LVAPALAALASGAPASAFRAAQEADWQVLAVPAGEELQGQPMSRAWPLAAAAPAALGVSLKVLAVLLAWAAVAPPAEPLVGVQPGEVEAQASGRRALQAWEGEVRESPGVVVPGA
jgi:hypothetical protein